jgi:Lrp/AsnC family transcriptional regulator, leucine-responsive regulatory protein
MINNKDMKVLVQLRKNARMQLTDISKHTGIPISTIYDRLKHKANNIILRHVSLINFELLGFNTRAYICIKCNKSSKKDILSHLSKHPSVNSMYKINNGFDYMIEVVFKNVKELEEFLEKLEEEYSVKTKQVYYIIDDLVREHFFSDELYMEMLKTREIS